MTAASSGLSDSTRHRLQEFWLAPEGTGLRELPFTVLILVIAGLVDALAEPPRPLLVLGSVLVTLTLQTVASLTHPVTWSPSWERLVPFAEILAVTLLDLGAISDFTNLYLLFFIPALRLGIGSSTGALRVGLAVIAALSMARVLADPQLLPAITAAISVCLIAVVSTRVHLVVAEIARQSAELEAARDALRSVMVAATEQAMIATDAQGRIIVVSTGAEVVFDCSADDLVGRPVTEFIPPPDQPPRPTPDRPTSSAGPTAEGFRRLVGAAAQGGTQTGQWRLVDAGGAEHLMEYVVTPRLATGTDSELATGYLIVATDVTERAQEERRQDEFVGLVSHELRTPLVSIMGYLDLLRLEGDSLGEEQREWVEVMTQSANRLRALVDELLTSARVVGGAPLAAADVDVVEIARESIAAARPMAAEARVAVELDADPTAPLVSDRVRLAQVIDNLLSNAIKYSSAGGRVQVVVRAEPTVEAGQAVRIEVIDEGVGISPDELNRITKPFYRTRQSQRRRVAGVGLGLSLVDALVAEHAGTLSLESQLGHGTRVQVMLPDVASPEAGGVDPGY